MSYVPNPAEPVSSVPRRSFLRDAFRLGIRQKVALVLLTTLVIALSGSGWLALRSQQEDILRETHVRGSELARFTALSLANSVVSYDYHAIEQWLQQAESNNEDIGYLRIVSDKGNTMAETGTHPAQSEGLSVFTEDIRANGERVGEVVLGLSTRRIAATFQKQKSSLIMSEFVVIVLIVLVEFAALSLIIIRPITLFSNVMGRARLSDEPVEPAAGGAAMLETDTARLPLASRDEIGDLARSFLRLQERTNLASDRLRQSEKRSRALVEAIPDMIFRLRRDGICLDCKTPRDLPTAFQPAEVIGKHVLEALPREIAATFLKHLHQALGTRQVQVFHYLHEVEGRARSFEARITVSGDDEVVVIVRDTTEHKHLEERIRFLAHFDSLTHLPNRLLFKERLHAAIGHAGRGEQSLAVLVMDIDHFKIINDTLGHDAGDLLLQGVAERLQRSLRATDYIARPGQDQPGVTISRPGGDEFTVLVTHLPDSSHAAIVARRVLEALKTPFRINGHEIGVNASMGIALYPTDGADADTLIRNADAAMHHAKSEGRNNYQYYAAEMNNTLSRRLALESGLRKALERKELRLHYQPQVEVASGRIVGVEALLRWSTDELGPVSPAEFIPLAEETGLIVPIGDWVLRTACAQNQAWQAMGLPPLRVAVNVSGVQFRQPNLAMQVREVLAETGLAPGLLELEVTEGVILRNDEQVIRTLAELRQIGVHLSLDDFGTGYSSLSYLKRFPLDTLKIDRSFVRDIKENADDSEIASAIIAMAHSLRLKVVAEGVESSGQFAFLQEQGCDLVQGYLFSPPVAAEKLVELLTAPARPAQRAAG